MYRISLVEDDPDLRHMLSLLIAGADDLKLVGRYACAESALTDIPRCRPHAVLVDIHLSSMSGIALVAQLKEQFPAMLFMMFTGLEDDARLFDSLRAGASGYLLKTEQPARLIEALLEMLAGGSPMSASIARRVVDHFAVFPKSPAGVLEELTPRETEVLELIAEGMLNKEVAQQLCVSINTVKNHVQNIYTKLQVNNRVEAANLYRDKD